MDPATAEKYYFGISMSGKSHSQASLPREISEYAAGKPSQLRQDHRNPREGQDIICDRLNLRLLEANLYYDRVNWLHL
jgi:hypothetical protein